MIEPLFDYTFRLILIGDTAVGKSTLLRSFTDAKFVESDPTVGVDFFSKILRVKNGVKIKLQLWDTAGQERFRSITQSYYRNSVGVILLYDITRKATFDNLIEWLFEVKHYIQDNSAIFMVIACKSDLEGERQVTAEQGKAFADFYSLHFFESSSKTGHNVEEPFQFITQEIYDRIVTGEFRLEEGWEGIKLGFTQPQGNFRLLEGEPVSTCC